MERKTKNERMREDDSSGESSSDSDGDVRRKKNERLRKPILLRMIIKLLNKR